MQDFFNKYQKNYKYSQNGEEGILDECLERIGDGGTCVEFGAHNGNYCSNTMRLLDNGWEGTMIEQDNELFRQLVSNCLNKSVFMFNDSVTPSNVNKYVTKDVSVLSIDTDGDNDYDCFHALEHSPAIVIVEINSSFPPSVLGRKDCYMDMVILGIHKGYFLLCHTGNLVFVHNEFRRLFPEIIGDGLSNSELYFNKSWLKP